MSPQDKQALTLPHHKLIAYQVAAELLRLVARIRITDAELRQQARIDDRLLLRAGLHHRDRAC